MKFSLPELALKRPVSVVMMAITLMGLGVIAWNRISVEFIPKMDFPVIRCWIPYPGATPEQVENEIAIPAEGEFRTVSHLKRIMSSSDSDGCSISMFFDWEADMAVATAEVRDRMERLRLKLPSDVDQLYLRRFSSKSLPILFMALFSEGDEEELAQLVRKRLQPLIQRVDGVAEVTVFSRPEKDILIEFDQNALRGRNLSLYEVVSKLQNSSLNLSVGELKEGQTKYYVRALGEFTDPREMADLVIGDNSLRLGEVAEVGYQSREWEHEFRMDQKGGAFLMVLKEAEANAISTCRAIHKEIERARKDPDLEGIEVFTFFDQSEIIMSALDSLMRAGKFGAGLALIVLLLFLRKIRPTLVVALAIPTSVMASLVFMFFTGMTLNIVTMCSLIIALGMLVDNAIVVIENIYRYNQLGYDPVESARRGASEVSMAITAATLTTVVVFVSLLYMDTGEMATYMRQFAFPITVALFASLGIALTVIPLATSRMRELTHLRDHPLLKGLAALGRVVHADKVIAKVALLGRFHPLKRIISAYLAALAWVMRWRLATVLMILAISVLTVAYPLRRLGQQGMPDIDTREVAIDIAFDQNFDMGMANETVRLITDSINTQREELGVKNVFVNYSPSGGQVSLYLYQPEDYPQGETPPYTTDEVMDILRKRMPKHMPGTELTFSKAQSEGSTSTISVSMRGSDRGTLDTLAEDFKGKLALVENVSEVKTDSERDTQEMRIKIDESLAERCGVSPAIIARTVDFALRGTRLPYLKKQGKEIAVWAQFREEDRKTRGNLDNVSVLTQQGELVPLNRLVSLEKAKSHKTINRVNGKNVMTITANVSGDDLAAVKTAIERIRAATFLPTGYTIELGDELLDLDQNVANFVTAVMLACILIYLVMGALFESYILPLSILTSIPLAFIGVWWVMFLTGTPMDTIAFIGIVLLVGIIVNNGIVIVDHVNQLRGQGIERLDAILQAGRDRFRPVMMTALTTILGCVPLAVGSGVGGEIAFYSLGRALIGGLTVGTLLTLFIVPLFYTLIDDLRGWFTQYAADLTGVRQRGTRKAVVGTTD